MTKDQIETKPTRWQKFLCRWKGHTFKLPDREHFSGSLLNLLQDGSCLRCKISYTDLWNAGWRP